MAAISPDSTRAVRLQRDSGYVRLDLGAEILNCAIQGTERHYAMPANSNATQSAQTGKIDMAPSIKAQFPGEGCGQNEARAVAQET